MHFFVVENFVIELQPHTFLLKDRIERKAFLSVVMIFLGTKTRENGSLVKSYPEHS